jgi:hypothetical protein
MKIFKPGEIVITNKKYPGTTFIALVLKQRDYGDQYDILQLTSQSRFRFKTGILYYDEMTRLCT